MGEERRGDQAHCVPDSGHPSTPSPARFRSVLFPCRGDGPQQELRDPPDFFPDLNLDQVVAAITSAWAEFDLEPFFYAPLRDVAAVVYRQEVMRDLEDSAVARAVAAFTERMRVARRYLGLADGLTYKEHREGWFLASATAYCEAATSLSNDLSTLSLKSQGLNDFREYLKEYTHSEPFEQMASESARLARELSAVRYSILIRGNRVVVRPYDGESDYGAAIEETFEKFRQGAVKDYRQAFKGSGMNHVEAQVLERVAWLNPSTFRALDAFSAQQADYPDETLLRFYREIQFYVAYRAYVDVFRGAGLAFCYPEVLDRSKEVSAKDAFDPGLAQKLLRGQAPVVPNSFFLREPERLFVVSGPNQGGKTTFARMFGQLHYLASLGCPVPGTEAHLFLFDHLFTLFEREEDIATLRGKLEDDLVRIRSILERATSDSIVVMNEMLASTTLRDALTLSTRVLERMSDLDLLGVCVTFLDELASLNSKTVSTVSTVSPHDPAVRTYRLERRPADGLAYALAIAEKHGVTYAQLKERIKT